MIRDIDYEIAEKVMGITKTLPYSSDFEAARMVESEIWRRGLYAEYVFALFCVTTEHDPKSSEAVVRWERGLSDLEYFHMVNASPYERCKAALIAIDCAPASAL